MIFGISIGLFLGLEAPSSTHFINVCKIVSESNPPISISQLFVIGNQSSLLVISIFSLWPSNISNNVVVIIVYKYDDDDDNGW